MRLTAKERQGRGLNALAVGLRPYVEAGMATVLPQATWVALYEAKETQRRNRAFRLSLDDPRQLLQMIRYERAAFPGIDASQRAWIEELTQAANRAAHAMTITDRESDRALDTMLLLAESLGLDTAVASLVELRLDAPDGPDASATPPAVVEESRAEEDTYVVYPKEPTSGAGTRDEPAREDLPAGIRVVSVRAGSVVAAVFHQEAVNLALTHNGVSPLRVLRVTNDGSAPVTVTSVEVALQAPAELGEQAVGTPLRLDIGVLQPGESFEAQTSDLTMRLNPAVFLRLDEAVTTSLSLTVSTAESTATASGPVRLLTAEEWWAVGIPELLAAFVRPNDPAVAELLRSASVIIGQRTGSSSLEGYQSGPGRVRAIAEAVFEALAARHITYVEPPASFEGTGQRIRSHSQVLADGLGTCLDLTCLYAAALEQAGVHPVLAVFKGHAFTGYLTEDEQLPAVVVLDQPTAVTIADSDFFDAVETTALCGPQPSFDDARDATSRWWSSDLGELRFLLDVHAAHHRVRPLPTIRTDDGTRVIEVVRDSTWATPRRAPARSEPRPAGPAARAEVPGRVQRWERALLDMTYANPLLKRKAATSLGVHVPTGGLGELEDEVAAGQTFRLFAHDEIEQIHRAQGARVAADIDPASVRAIMQREHTLFVTTPERDYARRLKALTRRSKTSIEETGADNLYLTLGSLLWTDGARQGAAPLFLVPVRLTGGRGVTRYALVLDESRERVPNYCLIEKLKTFGLQVPELETPSTDGSGIDVVGALGALRTAILRTRNTLGLHVEETADLALLQFSTLEMWQDLRSHWPEFIERPALAHLVHHAGSVFDDGIAPPEPRALDEVETYLPIPADGSQIEAIRWAGSGKTFILEGPPGTGKSQTITNLIADSMANGRRVLFVAEKAAALEVVQRRLSDVGLGVFSLDVHGRTQTVSAVRDQLRAALEEHAQPDTGWDPLQSAYASVTGRLADYPARLHEPGPVGLSAWEARQLVLEQVELGTPESDAVQVPRPVVLGGVALTDLYGWAQQLGAALTDLGRPPVSSAWRLAGVRDPDGLPREEIAAALGELRAAQAGLAAHPEAAALTRLLPPSELTALVTWLSTVENGTAWPPVAAAGVAAGSSSGPWSDEAHRRTEAVAAFRARAAGELGPFQESALDLPTEALLMRSTQADGKFFGKKRLRRQLLAELAPALQAEIALPEVTGALQHLDQLRRAREDLRGDVASLAGVTLRPGWSPLDDADVRWLGSTVTAIGAAARLRSVAASGLDAAGLRELDAVSERLTTHRVAGVDRGSGAVQRWSGAWRRFAGLLEVDDISERRWLGGRPLVDAVHADLDAWSADAAGAALLELQRWVRLAALLDRFAGLGLQQLVQQAYAGEVDPYELEPRLRLGTAAAVLEERLATTGLSGFDETDHGRRVAEFTTRGQTVRLRMPHQLRARVLAARTFNPDASVGQVAELRAELARRRGGRSVRRLLHDFEALITQITPCLMMSPQSVARFLPPTASFDLVVFDEASQIRVPEAIGAIGRAKAAVVVGDSKQMPPTSMFASSGESSEDETDDRPLPDSVLVPADLESILSEAVESQFPRKLLSWHYRSRNESLIAFSNAHYYDGRLSSFPVAPGSSTNPVELRRVDGVWEGGSRGATRINRAEAEAVVVEVKRLLVEDPTRSIGVVTFNSQQRDLVLDLLESDPDQAVADRLQSDDEPLFVKNLENVQGDERDVIVFTLAFSEDERGRIPLNWGPLTRAGGERRLNVAITRAKERVVVVTSFDPVKLDLSGSTSQGLNDLKDYLLLASAERTTSSRSRRGARDAHLDDVAEALADAGLEVRTNVGLSDFVVDLAVRTPDSSRWLALLLDGPAWASRLSVGDRETLPTSVLTRMGWTRVERVWLPTWLRNREGVIRSLVDAARHVDDEQHAGSGGQAADERSGPSSTPSPPGDVADTGHTPVRRDGAAPAPVVRADRPAYRSAYRAATEAAAHTAEELDGVRSRELIRTEILGAVTAEGPILVDRLIQVVAHRFGLSRVHERRSQQLRRVIEEYTVRRSANGDEVVWPPGSDPGVYENFRQPLPGQQRPLTAVPYEEIRNAMVQVARDSHGADGEAIIRETARLFGIGRLSSVARPRLETALTAAVGERRLVLRDGTITAPEPRS